MTVRITRTIAVAAVLACMALALPALSAAAPSASSTTSAKAASAANGINGMRARVGRGPLSISPSLSRSAQRYARTMLRRHFFAHSSRIQASGRFKKLGEALALQPGRARARSVVRMWRRSSGHYSLLTGSQFRQIGVGYATGRFNGRRVTLWVAQVGRQ